MKKILYILGVMGLILSSCTKIEELQNPTEGNGAVQFTANTLNTRVSDDGASWTVNDEIGVYAGTISNTKYKISDVANGTMAYVSGGEVYPQANQNYYAYYPYGTVTDDKLSVDLTTNQKPLLWARAEDQSGKDISLQFSHQLVQLNFTFKASGADFQIFSGANATLMSANAKGKFDVKSGAWSDMEAIDLPLAISTTNQSITLSTYVIPMASLTNVAIEIKTVDKIFEWQPTTTEWEKGKEYDYSIIVGEKPKIGDYYYSDGTYSTALDKNKTTIGIVYFVDADLLGGKVVSISKSTSKLKWSNNISTNIVCENTNGLVAMRNVFNTNEISDYPAFDYVHNLNKGNHSNYHSNAKNVWYLPGIDEMYPTEMRKYFLDDDSYWSSSQHWPSTKAEMINNSMPWGNSKEKTEEYYVRAILAF